MAITENKTKKQSFLSMSIGGGKSKGGKGKSAIARGKMPTKQSINLIIIDEKKINPIKAIVAIAVIVFLAVVFSKFMVIDRIAEMTRATGEVSRLRSSLEVVEAELDSIGDLKEEYAHYSYSGMTEEEQSLVDRSEVLKMADDAFASGNVVTNWRLSGNTLTAEVTGSTMEEINELAQLLETYPIVDRCDMTVANKTLSRTNKRDDIETVSVKATIIVYLQQPEEIEEGGDQ